MPSECITDSIALSQEGTMNLTKPVLGLAVGGTLGLLDGLSGFFELSLAPFIGSVITFSLLKGLVAGIATGYVSQRVHSMLLGIVANPEKHEAAKGKDELILKMVKDRSHKETAPEPIDPAKQTSRTPQEAMKLFLDSRAHSIEYVKTTQEDLRDHLFDHPVPAIGTVDAYQWILFMSGHTRRHTAQILEVKADANFPKI